MLDFNTAITALGQYEVTRPKDESSTTDLLTTKGNLVKKIFYFWIPQELRISNVVKAYTDIIKKTQTTDLNRHALSQAQEGLKKLSVKCTKSSDKKKLDEAIRQLGRLLLNIDLMEKLLQEQISSSYSTLTTMISAHLLDGKPSELAQSTISLPRLANMDFSQLKAEFSHVQNLIKATAIILATLSNIIDPPQDDDSDEEEVVSLPPTLIQDDFEEDFNSIEKELESFCSSQHPSDVDQWPTSNELLQLEREFNESLEMLSNDTSA